MIERVSRLVLISPNYIISHEWKTPVTLSAGCASVRRHRSRLSRGGFGRSDDAGSDYIAGGSSGFGRRSSSKVKSRPARLERNRDGANGGNYTRSLDSLSSFLSLGRRGETNAPNRDCSTPPAVAQSGRRRRDRRDQSRSRGIPDRNGRGSTRLGMEQVHELSLAPFHVATRDFVVGCDFQGRWFAAMACLRYRSTAGRSSGGCQAFLRSSSKAPASRRWAVGSSGFLLTTSRAKQTNRSAICLARSRWLALRSAAAISWNQLVK